MTNLKPCPFCGGDADLRKSNVGYIVKCMCCPTDFGRAWFFTEKEAVEMWNRRANDD